MRLALITRPQWDPPLVSFIDHDPRLVRAPLQRLRLCAVDEAKFSQWRQTPSGSSRWLVLTSPASVVALQRWCAAHDADLLSGELNVAAVGGGTRDQAAKLLNLDAQKIIVSDAVESADAGSLIAALAAYGESKKSSGFDWDRQSFLVIEGQGNRPTLRKGLQGLGAHVLTMALYARIDVDWPREIWSMIAQGSMGVVVTSSAMASRLIAEFSQHAIALDAVIWCTQHATIARHLKEHGVGRVRRVRLDEGLLQNDLFADEQYW